MRQQTTLRKPFTLFLQLRLSLSLTSALTESRLRARARFVWVQSRAFFAQDVRRVTIQKAIMKLTNDGTTDRTSDIYDAERRQGEEEEEEEEKEGEERIVLASDADAAENRISRPNYRERERERERETDAISRGGQEGGWADGREETGRGKYKSNPSRQKAGVVKYCPPARPVEFAVALGIPRWISYKIRHRRERERESDFAHVRVRTPKN